MKPNIERKSISTLRSVSSDFSRNCANDASIVEEEGYKHVTVGIFLRVIYEHFVNKEVEV